MLFADLAGACGEDPSLFCEWVFDRTGSEGFTVVVDWFVTRPLTILLILVVAWVVRRIVVRGIREAGEAVLSDDSERLARVRERAPELFQGAAARRTARTQSLVSVSCSLVTMLIWGIALLLVLSELGINLAPLLAGAGIAGIAIGFGAQSVVKDFLSGLFLLVEDQFGVGDVVNVGEVTGTVERVSMRTTVLRDVNGTVWHVPNG